jgi:two-component system sensor histidine kinase HydH
MADVATALREWLRLVTWVAEFALASLALARVRKSVLALPLAILCLVLFAWGFAEWAYRVSRVPEFRVVDLTLAPMTTPAALHFILAFTGTRRRYRRVLIAITVASGALGLACASAAFSEWGRDFARSALRGQIQSVLMFVSMSLGLYLLVRHAREQVEAKEQIRVRLVIAAALVGAALGAAEVLDAFVLPIPPMLVTTALLAVTALRFQLFEQGPSRMSVLYALTLATLFAIAYVAVFRLLAARHAVLVLALVVVTVALTVAVRSLLLGAGRERARRERLFVLGRMAGQMAHDLKNPLAAIKGAAQILLEERARGRSIDDQTELLEILAQESDRLAALVTRYGRVDALELSMTSADVPSIVTSMARSKETLLPLGARVDVEFEPDLPTCELDVDLFTAALENVVSNAIEALRDGGTVMVRVARSEDDQHALRISVTDDGIGMDPREREHAWEEFFTTKPNGSGLGLPFVKRVVEAHGGTVVLTSRRGAGTTVTMLVPRAPAHM